MSKLTLKQQRFADEYIITKKINAANELIKRYLNFSSLISDELANECLYVIFSASALSSQKKAARVILNSKYGRTKANNLIEKDAVITERNDALVNRWRKSIRERDVICQLCNSSESLEVHHISHWANDPINRVNKNNGILLCSSCHAKQHPEISPGMFGGAKHER